ncbi:uncharacterized protein BDR25DRAFT_317999 [Lindgomyces ingoldianus]|uniref:Uncharacterized protein n=1 Tax=Lindgomyces ingoldianus TaxID=673940 RepID=A0ACB6QG23_9PLEO|nr:uncharacterized protein BDR25DRAFT_317999 [Lindgomyces ingoldianus]KAF2465842.1 hypothetical protein BDR25DRAFT_317999 [Lindgomyces ingoldianus]
MGGNAFKHRLYTPRISAALYRQIRTQASAILRTFFTHVIVPTELPSKSDFGDVDFFVGGPLPHALFPNTNDCKPDLWSTVSALKTAFITPHGFQVKLNLDVIFLAVMPLSPPAMLRERGFWVQIDVKICGYGSESTAVNVERFQWEVFQLHYASVAKILGSMVKPVGLTMDPEGLWVRVEEMEGANFGASKVWLTAELRTVLEVLGLDERVLNKGFGCNKELFEYLSSWWLFNPAHFVERLKNREYRKRLEERASWWRYFVSEWTPRRLPENRFPASDSDPARAASAHCLLANAEGDADMDVDIDVDMSEDYEDLAQWYKSTRTIVRSRVFSMFPPNVQSEISTRSGRRKC